MSSETELNFIERAHLQRAGIDLTNLSADLPVDVLRQIHSDIIPSTLRFEYDSFTRAPKWDPTYLAEIEQNPLTRQFLESLSLLYATAKDRGWDLTGPVNEEFQEITNPVYIGGWDWRDHTRTLFNHIYPAGRMKPSHIKAGLKDPTVRHNYLVYFLCRQFSSVNNGADSVSQAHIAFAQTSHAKLFNILLAEKAVPLRYKHKWRKIAKKVTAIAENTIQYEQKTRVN